MSAAFSSRFVSRARAGSALVIVLFFVILLTVLTIAFLARSITAVKVSASSAGETKASILANSAGNIIIGDLKQEIIAGSSSMGASVAWPFYTPNSSATMIPFQNGIPSGMAIPNMISRSVSPSDSAGTAPYVAYTAANYTAASVPPNRAAADTTTSTAETCSATAPFTTAKASSAYPSLNGRYISPAQWNMHYLIPRNTTVDAAGSTSADSTPVTSFVPPDWVIVTRAGANSVPWKTGSGGLNDPTLSNTNYAVGRYAYAVYNEGGLLDMNVAGYPADPTNPGATGSNGLTSAQSSGKGSLALADLTQLTAGTTSITQAQVNSIVGWRNYSSAQLSASNGTFPNFSFSASTASNWLTNFVTANTNGFMQIVSGTTTPTDQAFISRQQLITLIQSLGMSPDFLQYMATFTRGLDQPSFLPDPARPTIINATIPPPSEANVDTYAGNNDNAGKDAADNPSLLSKRVTATFTRINGSTAVVGEPLVKTKFPLSWLSMVTYTATATKSTTDPIYQRFGIFRASASVPWIYNHGNGSTPASSILSLAQVASQKRDPDFAELLKAAISAGSLGKAGPNLHSNQQNYQYTLDAQMDLQVIQIMANLIDQQDTDSYPTAITFSNGTQGIVTVYGVEDLPYFYRYQLLPVVTRQPSPMVPIASMVTFPAATTETGTTPTATAYPGGGTSSKTWTVSAAVACTYKGCIAAAPGTLKDQGEATLMYIPELWNPHDPNTVSTSASRPTQFRICAATIDPVSLLATPWTIGAETQMNGFGGKFDTLPENDTVVTPFPTTPANYFWPISGGGSPATAAPISWPMTSSTVAPATNTVLTFSDNGGKLFREPTLLWNTNPTGLSLSGQSVKDINTSQTYYGIVAGKSPISIQATITSSPSQATDGSYIFQGSALTMTALQPASYGGNLWSQITFLLQYADPNTSGNWITYDVQYPEDSHSGLTSGTLIVNPSDYPDGSWQSPLKNNQMSSCASVMDPRTARWGVGTAATLGNVPGVGGTQDYLLEPTANGYVASNNYTSMENESFNVFESNRPRVDAGNIVDFSNPCQTHDVGRSQQMRWFSPLEYRFGSSTSWGGSPTSPLEFDGLFSQNNPAIQSTVLSQNGTTKDQIYNEDPDGVARPAMGAYADTTLAGSTVGLPLATACTFDNNATPKTVTSQSQSRPIVLNRPFRSVSEMSYAFRGTPWKNIDFFNPQSGDSALLDTFCVNPPPSNALVAGKVDLNTRQLPVLQALLAGSYVDEVNNSAAPPPTYALPGLTATEAKNVATTLSKITTDTTHAWRGPLENVSTLVGKYVATPGTTTDTDLVTYVPPSPVTGQATSISYAGLSSALDCSSFFGTANHVYANSSTPLIQRFRESALRPLADAGQVRVWNLLIDLVVQTGRYPQSATGLDQFLVDGQRRVWIHVAIDRLTGQVLDKQVEFVTP